MEEMIYKVRLHHKRPTKRYPHILAVTMWGDNTYGCWRRILTNRRIDVGWFLERDMDAREREEFDRSRRYRCHLYMNWETLIKDEFRITGDASWCMQIHNRSGLGDRLETILAGIQ